MRDPFTASYRLRQRYVSDSTWYGLCFLAFGLALVSGSEPLGGWLRLVGLIPLVIGALLMFSGLNRALHRTDPQTGKARPAPPW